MKLALTALFVGSVFSDVTLEDFSKPIHKWSEKNDPVMGGRSTGTFNIENNLGIFDGKVVDVPALKAPGFITTQTVDRTEFADVSACKALTLTAKSTTNFAGYRVSFGTAHAKGGKFFAYGYKAHFDAPMDDFQTITIPFTNFSDFWDDATGNQIKTCADDSQYCPDEMTLKNMKTITIWGEGVGGDVHLEIKSIGATQCSSTSALTVSPSEYAVDVATFDGKDSRTSVKWSVTNDPVMGGRSTSTFVVDNNIAVFNGTCRVVPQLKAPGFCNAQSAINFRNHFPDVSEYTHMILKVRTSTPSYTGYKLSFAANTLNPQFKSFKANFKVAAGSDWQYVAVPFSSFSNDWSPYTGDCDTKDPTGTQHHCCSSEHPEVCPTVKNLRSIEQVGMWTEGEAGDFHLEVERIGAGNATNVNKATLVPVAKATA